MRKILIILSLILCGSVLFGQSPRIRLNQITKDSLTGSVVLSGSDSNMVYSRDFFLNLTDSVLILFGDTLSTTATAFTGVATDLTLTGNGTVGNELKVDTAIIATVSALADSLAGIISSVTTDLTLTGDGSVATPLKVDTAVIATIRALADSVATRGTVSSVAVSAGTGISVSGSPITTSGTITVTNTAPNATHTGDVTGSSDLTIANDAVTNAKMANMAQNTIKGRITASTGDPEDLTASQVRTILNVADGATANTGTVTSVTGTGTVNGISLSGTVTSSGNLTLGGTLSNVNLASQVTGTLPVANGGTNVTSLTANGILYGSSTSQVATSSGLTFDGTNLATTGTATATKFIPTGTSATGNGMYLPAANTLGFSTNGTNKLTIDASGNLGLGVTPSAWNLGTAMQFTAGSLWSLSTTDFNVMSNTFSSNGFRYVNSTGALRYFQDASTGIHAWYNAPSGTAGNAISFTQAMTLNASGNLSIGNTNDTYKLDVSGTGYFSSTVTLGGGSRIAAVTGNGLNFNTGGADRLTITSGGNVGIGTNDPATRLHVDGTIRYTDIPAAGTITNIGFDTNGDLKASSSSQRYKYNIRPYEKGLNIVTQLNPVYFSYNGESRDNVGFIAEDFDNLGLSELTLYQNETIPEGIIYSNITALLTKAIQEQQAIIETQQQEIEQLKTQIQNILTEINNLKNN